MEFSAGVLDEAGANSRFDRMLAAAEDVPFAKRPVIERHSGLVVGYVGVGWMDFEGARRLEFGYRFVPEARGLGYATEGGVAMLALAEEAFAGELLATIDPTNIASKRVAAKLGFEFWKIAEVNGFVDEVHRRHVGARALLPDSPTAQ